MTLRENVYPTRNPVLPKVKVVDTPLNSKLFFAMLALHALMGVIFYFEKSFAFLQVICVLLMTVAAINDRNKTQILYIVGYVIGTETLWRTLGAGPLYEFGKYFSAFCFTLFILIDRKRNIPVPALLIGLLLLPSVFTTLLTVSAASARDKISFYLSFYILLIVAIVFFSKLVINYKTMLNLLLAMLYPIVSQAVFLLITVIRNPNVIWTNDSNLQTSGGFGPNQVSTTLTAGVLICIWLLTMFSRAFSPGKRLILAGVAFALFIQSLLTFSRGGLYILIITVGVGLIYYVLVTGRVRMLLGVIALLALMIPVVSVLNSLTGDALSIRFADLNTSGRLDLMQQGVQAFERSPLTGIGVGLFAQLTNGTSSHAEQIRLLAEHGVLGILIYALMVIPLVRRIWHNHDIRIQTFMVAVLVWTNVYILYTDTRTALPAFWMGFLYATVSFDDRDAKET